MDLEEAYAILAALQEPAALLEGGYGPLTGEQRSYAQMIYEGSLKVRQWIEDWFVLDKQALTPDALALHAHKVNGGLTMMLGYASLLLTGAGGPITAEIDTALKTIVGAGEQMHSAMQRDFDARLRELSGE